jgi:hypothetical protein
MNLLEPYIPNQWMKKIYEHQYTKNIVNSHHNSELLNQFKSENYNNIGSENTYINIKINNLSGSNIKEIKNLRELVLFSINWREEFDVADIEHIILRENADGTTLRDSNNLSICDSHITRHSYVSFVYRDKTYKGWNELLPDIMEYETYNKNMFRGGVDITVITHDESHRCIRDFSPDELELICDNWKQRADVSIDLFIEHGDESFELEKNMTGIWTSTYKESLKNRPDRFNYIVDLEYSRVSTIDEDALLKRDTIIYYDRDDYNPNIEDYDDYFNNAEETGLVD